MISMNNNIIYGDLKPANILLDNAKNAFLTDFGTIKFINEITQGDHGYSARYAPPE